MSCHYNSVKALLQIKHILNAYPKQKKYEETKEKSQWNSMYSLHFYGIAYTFYTVEATVL